MLIGPVELLMIQFSGHQFNNEMVSTLVDVVDKGMIRVIDIIFFKKDYAGNLAILELDQLSVSETAIFDAITDEVNGFLTEDDIQEFAVMLEPNSIACVLLFEHCWEARLRNEIQHQQGNVVLHSRISQPVMNRVINQELSILAGMGEQYSSQLSSDSYVA